MIKDNLMQIVAAVELNNFGATLGSVATKRATSKASLDS